MTTLEWPHNKPLDGTIPTQNHNNSCSYGVNAHFHRHSGFLISLYSAIGITCVNPTKVKYRLHSNKAPLLKNVVRQDQMESLGISYWDAGFL